MKNTVDIADNQIYDIIIIGAGASGLFAAASADLHAKGTAAKGTASSFNGTPFKGLILEKTARAGTKLLMSGSGQCNITHAGSIKDFLSCYADNGKKIRSCLYKHSNLKLMGFLEENGIEVFIREDGKVFPKSMDAHEVLYMLLRRGKKNGFELKCDCEVTDLKQLAQDLWQISCDGKSYCARSVIIATGGCSYPTTGSDGSFFRVLQRDLDIEITALKPSLTPIQVNEYPYAELSGISLKNVHTSIWHEDKKIAELGEALHFKHKDLSGQAVINISKTASPGYNLNLNYLQPSKYEDVLGKLKELLHGSNASTANGISAAFDLPKRFSQLITERSGPSLKELAKNLTGEEFIINSVSGFHKAMATCGGIDLKQISTVTFEFKDHPNLYAIGEALDVDGITGGYNLQFAYSSAMAAMVGIMDR